MQQRLGSYAAVTVVITALLATGCHGLSGKVAGRDAWAPERDGPAASGRSPRLPEYDAAVEARPEDPFVWHNRGAARHAAGDYAGAVADYSRAIRLDGRFQLAYSNRGLARHELEQYDAALADYARAIELGPEATPPYVNRGLTLWKLGDYDGAIRDYDHVIERESSLALAWNNRGWARHAKGDYQGAIADYNEAIRLDGGDPVAWNNRGWSRYHLRQWPLAMADYYQALQLNPNYAHAHGNLALLLATCPDGSLRDPKAALLHARRARDLSGYDDHGVLEQLAEHEELIETTEGVVSQWAARFGLTP